VFNGIASIIGNPLTSEEKKRLLELINKDDLTPEEADEFERLVWRFWEEHMDLRGAWYLLLYAAAKRGETYGKHNKKLTPLDLPKFQPGLYRGIGFLKQGVTPKLGVPHGL
jgi:hypothetical protein